MIVMIAESSEAKLSSDTVKCPVCAAEWATALPEGGLKFAKTCGHLRLRLMTEGELEPIGGWKSDMFEASYRSILSTQLCEGYPEAFPLWFDEDILEKMSCEGLERFLIVPPRVRSEELRWVGFGYSEFVRSSTAQ